MCAFCYFVMIFSGAMQSVLRNGRERRISDLVRITDALAGWGFTSSSRSANRCETTFLLMVRRMSLFLRGYHLVASATGGFPSTLASFNGGEMLQLGSVSTEVFRFCEICVAVESFR